MVSALPLTALGQVITKSNKLISDGIHTVATAAKSSTTAIRQFAKDASSSFNETFSLQRKPIDFSSVSLPPTLLTTTSELPTPQPDRSTPPSTMPKPSELVHASLYPSLMDDQASSPSEWEPRAEGTLTVPAVGNLHFTPPRYVAPIVGRIAVKYAGNEGDALFIRGTGPKMGYWSQGVEMRKEGDMWIYDLTDPFEKFEYKVMLNNHFWEEGNNHTISVGQINEIPEIKFHDFR